jgi:D-alanyl-D-alanine carboxypeptidase/D-alanyl-D-alanine-endopeptidase (penicillin-binding protein 4)
MIRSGLPFPFGLVAALALCVALPTLAVQPPHSPSASPPALRDQIDRVLQQRQAEGAFWGGAVRDLETGEMLYARNPDKGFLPASNQKLLTTATALDALGPTYRYETTLHFDGSVRDSTLRGDLIVRGSGDPTFGSLELRSTDPLQRWAERLAQMGVRRVQGRLIGDDNSFDDRPYPEGWNVDYITRQSGRYIGASAGGLSYRDNVVAVEVTSSAPGQAPHVEVRPAGAVQVTNEARTSSRGRGSSLQITRAFESNHLFLEGSVPRSYRGTKHVPVSNPTTYTLRNFVRHLQDAGIETSLRVVDIDDLEESVTRADPLFVSLSPPLSEIVAAINKRSNNFYAEQVFRTYGWGGSTRGASRRTDTFLRRADIDTRDILVSDGSGLSRKNLISPRAMVHLLAHMNDHEARNAFLASLPGGGENNTTLEYRLHREPVQAKTGSLRFVRALSGYAQRPNGHRVAFAFFANNYTGPSYQIARTIDDIVETITSAPAS